MSPLPAFGAAHLTVTRRSLAVALSLTALAAVAGLAPGFADDGKAQSAVAALVAKPGSLPDMALGSAKAPVTIVEYASMTCPHCAAFEQNVLPMLKSKYIDSGKVRFVFREFPLEIKAAAAAILARCIAGDDAGKFFDAVDQLFKAQDQLLQYTLETLRLIGKRQSGMNDEAVASCETDQALLDKIKADQNFAFETLKVEVTPTFFINGEKIKGAMTFEEIDKKIGSLLKR